MANIRVRNVSGLGIFRTDMAIAAMARPDEARVIANVIVDSGSEYTWIPRPMLEELGVGVERIERFQTADGDILEREIGGAFVRVAGRGTPTVVVFAEPGDLTLLGALAIEGMNLRVDLIEKRLVPAGPVPVAAARAA